jgi:hypothetical protein
MEVSLNCGWQVHPSMRDYVSIAPGFCRYLNPTIALMYFNALRRAGLWAALLLLLCAADAQACSICAPSDLQNTLMRRLAAADRVVLAQWAVPGGLAHPLVSASGLLPQSDLMVAGVLPGADALPPRLAGDAHLLLFNAGSQTWWSAGRLGVQRLPWLLEAMKMPVATADRTELQLERARFFVRGLEDAEPLIARAAYDEIATLPYATLRRVAPWVDAAALAVWVEDPALLSRRPLYYLLWGLQKKSGTLALLQAQLAQANTTLPVAELSALLAALVEQGGAEGLLWVQQRFLQDPKIPDPSTQAALLALSVHGGEAVRVTRQQVVQAYSAFIAANPQRAGLVASDLGTWEHWEFAQDFAQALQSGPGHAFTSRYAIVFYLLRNPTPEAKTALERLRSAGLL